MDVWRARVLADEIVRLIRPYCKKVEIVGSIRRGERKVKDIDILAMVNVERRKQQETMFGVPAAFDVVDPLREFLRSWGGTADHEVLSVGPALIKMRADSLDVDLWTVYDVERWGIAVAFRTGPAEFSKALARVALYRHQHVIDYLLHGHEQGGRPGNRTACKDDLECKRVVDTSTEEKFFYALGLPYMQPEARNTDMMVKASRKMMEARSGR